MNGISASPEGKPSTGSKINVLLRLEQAATKNQSHNETLREGQEFNNPHHFDVTIRNLNIKQYGSHLPWTASEGRQCFQDGKLIRVVTDLTESGCGADHNRACWCKPAKPKRRYGKSAPETAPAAKTSNRGKLGRLDCEQRASAFPAARGGESGQ